MKILQAVKKIFAENFLPAQIINVLRAELHILDVLNDLFKTGEDCKAAAVRVATIEHVEHHTGIFAAVDEVAVCHCHFIKIHHHGQISFIKLRHTDSSVADAKETFFNACLFF